MEYIRNANDEPTKVRLLPQLWASGNDLNPILKPLYVSILHTLLSFERNSHIRAQIIAEFRRILHEEPTALDAGLSTSLFTTLRQIIANHNPREADVVVDFSYGCLMKLIPQRRSVLGPKLLQTFAEVAATTLSQPHVAAQYIDINCVVVASILESCDEQSLPTIVSICINAARLFQLTIARRKTIEDVVLIRLTTSVIRCFTAVLRWPLLPPFVNWKPAFYRSISTVLISCLLSGVDSIAASGSALLAQTATTTGQYLQFFVGDFSLYFLISVARLLHPARLKFPQFTKQMQSIRAMEEEKRALADSVDSNEAVPRPNSSSHSSPNGRSVSSSKVASSAPIGSSIGGPGNLRNSLFGDELTPGDPSAPLPSFASHLSSGTGSPLSTINRYSPEPAEMTEDELPCAAILNELYSLPTTAERQHRLTKDGLLPELAFLADYPVSIVSLSEGDNSAYGQFQSDLWNALNVTRSALCHILLCLIHVRGRTQQQLVELLSLWYDRMSFSGHFILVDVLNKALMSILVKADGQSVPLILGLTTNPAASPPSLRSSSSSPLAPLHASSSPHSSVANIAAVTGTNLLTNSSSGSIPAFPSPSGSPNPHTLPLTASDANQNELKKRIADMERELKSLTSERADLTSQVAEQTKTINSINNEKEALLNQIACAVCFENILDNKPVCLDCGHLFCGSCVDNLMKTHKNCPLCKSEIGKITLVKGL